MHSLLLFIDDGMKFNHSKVAEILNSIPGVSNLEKGDFVQSILQCAYDFEQDKTTIRLSDDFETISIDGTGDASLKIALEIQHQYDHPIRAVDTNYNFDFFLQGINSVSEFRKKIKEQNDR